MHVPVDPTRGVPMYPTTMGELKLRFPSHHLEQCQSKHYKVEVHILNYIYSYYNVKVQDILTVR